MVDIDQSTFWTSAVLIRSGVRHAIEHDKGLACTIYLDPDGEVSAGLNRVLQRESFINLSGSLERVVRRCAWRVIASGAQSEKAFAEFSWFFGSRKTGHDCDPRIDAALAVLVEDRRGPWPLAGLAEAAGVSPSRFSALFKDSTGLPLRAYARWLRFQTAIYMLSKNGDLTTAARAAGYSSALQCTYQFRHMFGVSPAIFAKSLRNRR